MVSHGGMGFGFSGFFMIFPNKNISAIILCNEETFAHDQLYYAVAETIMGRKPKAGKPSWIMPLTDAYLSSGKKGILEKAKELISIKQTVFTTDQEDFMNLIYQMIIAKKSEALSDFLEVFMELYPNDQEAKELSIIKI